MFWKYSTHFLFLFLCFLCSNRSKRRRGRKWREKMRDWNQIIESWFIIRLFAVRGRGREGESTPFIRSKNIKAVRSLLREDEEKQNIRQTERDSLPPSLSTYRPFLVSICNSKWQLITKYTTANISPITHAISHYLKQSFI